MYVAAPTAIYGVATLSALRSDRWPARVGQHMPRHRSNSNLEQSMNTKFKLALGAAAVVVAAQATADVILYEHDNFQGRAFTTERSLDKLKRDGFNDRASSVVVRGERWEVCEDRRFRGRCVVLRPGRYSSSAAMGLNDQISSVRSVPKNKRIDERNYAPAPVVTKITFYENPGFSGRSFTTEQSVLNFNQYGFNDRASSAEVVGQSWEVCEDTRFSGRCAVLRPGRYPSFSAMGLNNRASSVRSIESNASMPATDYRRRDNERLYEAPVTSVRAVLDTPEQRCWVEREQVAQNQNSTNVPAAIAGALIGGILGHQVGGGTGKDLATVGGAVAGAAVGAQVGRNSNGSPANTQDIRRCETVPNQAVPRFWDVGYTFRGQAYQVQMTTRPGSTVTVNGQGEPRN